MRDYLKATFSDDERRLAAEIGQQQEQDVEARVKSLFDALRSRDPLLSADDVSELLGIEKASDVKEALLRLNQNGALDVSTKTQRPFDAEGVELFRLADVPFQRLKLLSVQSESPSGEARLQLTCDGRLVRSIARVSRLDIISGAGQQRDEINRHINKIAQGIESGTEVPNSILLVLLEPNYVEVVDSEDFPESFILVRPLGDYATIYRPGDTSGAPIQRVRQVELDFPYRPAAFDEEKSALLVDGQQRTAALSLVSIDDVPTVDLAVNAVVADENEAKRVFQVANDTVKIATDFSRALLASMPDAPGYLKAERLRAAVCKRLAIDDDDSPFKDLVKHPGLKAGAKPIAYNSLFHVVTLFEEAALPATDDQDALTGYIKRSFEIVKSVWSEAWGLKPTESRLMHAVGLRSVAELIVHKLESKHENGQDLSSDAVWSDLRASISRMRPRIVWTDEMAASGTREAKKIWREEISHRQNTNQDIKALTTFLRKESLHLDEEARRAVARSR